MSLNRGPAIVFSVGMTLGTLAFGEESDNTKMNKGDGSESSAHVVTHASL
jgi:hypothetical protein